MNKTSALQRLRETLVLALLVLLPFHAFSVTALTALLTGPGHAPLGALAVWKEGVLAVVTLIALCEIVAVRVRIRLDRIDVLVLTLCILSLLVTFLTHGDLRLAALGFKYDFLAPLCFLLLRRAAWSDAFIRRAFHALVWVGGIVATYGILTLALPRSFFAALGYSDAYSLYFPGKPLTSFQLLAPTGLRRIQSVMSGPNQLGTWLLLPWAIGLTGLMRRQGWRRQFLLLTMLAGVALLLTFSRAAWIAAAAIAAAVAWRRGGRGRFSLRRLWLVVASSIGVLIVAGVLAFPHVLVRLGSSRGHIERPVEAARRMIASPLGAGLGAVGPAAHRVSDVCVFLRPQDDPSWARDIADLCVFTGDTQVQPAGKTCRCPFLPENWYLQIGVESGVLGFVLFLCLTVLMLRSLAARNGDDERGHVAEIALLVFLGVSVVAFFLHAWEDAAVAYGTWLLAAMILPPRSRQ